MSSAAERAPRIALLPEHVRNQIAAGEVVERPSSIVKELCENSLDAGARHVRVDLESGGLQLVRVVDDGSGMSRADLELAIVAHATSKLRELADLEHIASLGFRGEALASIASVARLSIVSRPSDDTSGIGHELRAEGGVVTGPLEAGAERGTRIEVRDLFHALPARRAFMKTPAAELARCLDYFQRLALAHDGVGFQLTHDGRRVYDVGADLDLRERVRRTFGAELAEALVPVEAAERGMRLSGYLAPPRLSRRDATRTMWFLNGRALKDKLLARLLKEAFRGFDDSGRTPVCFLRLELDPAEVDVNVHPTKSEVRFREERRVFGFALAALRRTLAAADLSTPGAALAPHAFPSSAADAQGGVERAAILPFATQWRPDLAARAGPAPVHSPALSSALSSAHFATPPAPSSAAAAASASAAAAASAAGSAFASALTPLDAAAAEYALGGLPDACVQVAASYIVRALPDGFEVIDQHALHERITYEELRAELASGALEVQRWLVPELVDLSRAEVALLASWCAELAQIGLVFEPFGETTIAVHALPARLAHPRPTAIVRDVAAFLEECERSPKPEDVLEAALQRAACRSSVMAGDVLSIEAMRALLARGRKLENDQTCVHGRPTRVHFRLADLERAFHRR
jgi:DNA mismatch repair protein MutL